MSTHVFNRSTSASRGLRRIAAYAQHPFRHLFYGSLGGVGYNVALTAELARLNLAVKLYSFVANNL